MKRGLAAAILLLLGTVGGTIIYFKQPAPQQASPPVTMPEKKPHADEFTPFARLMDAPRWKELSKDIRKHQFLSGRENNENVLRGGTDWHINDTLEKQEWDATYRCVLFVDNDPQESLETITINRGEDTLLIMRFGVFGDKGGAWVVRTKNYSITQDEKAATKTETKPGTTPLTNEEAEKRLAQCKELLERIAGSR